MEKKPKILVVDDEPLNVKLLEAHLIPQGYVVITASSGQVALDLVMTEPVDLILLDVMMPGLDGFEVTRRLRADERTRLVPIVLITALKETVDRIRGIEAGCDDFISKPFDRNEVLARVKALLKISYYRSLLDEKEKFEYVIEHMEEGLLVFTSELKISRLNQKAADLLMIPRETIGAASAISTTGAASAASPASATSAASPASITNVPVAPSTPSAASPTSATSAASPTSATSDTSATQDFDFFSHIKSHFIIHYEQQGDLDYEQQGDLDYEQQGELDYEQQGDLAWPRAMKTKAVFFDLERPETEKVKALFLEARSSLIRNPAGEISSIMLTINDVTEQRREAWLKQNFLNLISHKLRTPVTVITQTTLMLQEGILGHLNEKQQNSLEAILRKSQSLESLMKKLIGFTASAAATMGTKSALGKESLELKAFLSALVLDLAGRKKEKKTSIALDGLDQEVRASITKEYLGLIMDELLENAIKFNDKEEVQIVVAVRKTPDKVMISVADNGLGIPPEDKGKIFEKFYQIEKYFTGNVEGAGLGLALVKHLVSACGGEISVESTLNQGSTFIISLNYPIRLEA